MRPRRTRSASRPPVDVIVPCYNYGVFLPDCVDSILGQPGVDVRVLIIDDASTDRSGSVAEDVAASDRRVRVIRHEVNRGHIATYNEGLAHATADYVVLLSADDLLTPGCLARATELMQAHPSVALVYGRSRHFTQDVPRTRSRARSWTIWDGATWAERQVTRAVNPIDSPEVVVRTSSHQRVGGYTDTLPHTGDLEMWLRLSTVGDIARVNGPDQALRRVHAASMMHTVYGSVLQDIGGRLDAFERYLDYRAVRDAERLRARMRAQLAWEAVRWACVLLRRDRDDPDPRREQDVRACVDFARMTDPEVVSRPQWTELEVLLGTDGREPLRRRIVAERVRAGRALRYRSARVMSQLGL